MMMKTPIPKRIHYCWFGGTDKLETVEACLNSWKVNLPDYQFMEWNEDNFDVHSNRYAGEAYETKSYSFLHDYVKLHVLYQYGGIYMDTDRTIIKPFNDLLHHESFWGFEQDHSVATGIIGAAPGNRLIKLFLDQYRHKRFIKEDGSFNPLTGTELVTKTLEQIGMHRNGKYQRIEDAGTFYPQPYFSISGTTEQLAEETYVYRSEARSASKSYLINRRIRNV